jgi:hypothetical protein
MILVVVGRCVQALSWVACKDAGVARRVRVKMEW